jgi:hypothetical protein
MTDRERKLEECYRILIEKGNTFMASNVRKALEDERKNPRSEG